MVDILSFKSLEWRREVENEYFISSQSIDTEMARGTGPAAGAGEDHCQTWFDQCIIWCNVHTLNIELNVYLEGHVTCYQASTILLKGMMDLPEQKRLACCNRI